MDELVKLVSEKTGISEAQSKTAVETVLNFLGDKLPEPIGSQLENYLEGDGGVAGGLMKGLGGMLGNR